MYLKSIRFGKEDGIHQPIEVTNNAADPLEIVYSTKVAEVSGTVKDRDEKPVGGALVTVWPKTPELGLELGGVHSSTTDQDGKFEIHDLGPGAYYLASWEEIAPALLRYAEFPMRFNAEASEIKVEEGGKASLDLKLIPHDRIAAELAKLP